MVAVLVVLNWTSSQQACFGKDKFECIPSTVADMFFYGAARQTEQNSAAVAALSPSHESSSNLELQIQSIPGEISRFGRLIHMALRAKQNSPKEFLVLVSPTAHLLPKELAAATFHGPQIATKKQNEKYSTWQVGEAPVRTDPNNDGACRILSVVVSAIGMSLRCSWEDKQDHFPTVEHHSGATPAEDASSAKDSPKKASSVKQERIVDKGTQYEIWPANSLFFRVCDKEGRDFTIATAPGRYAGVELKSSHKGGLVQVGALDKRRYQTGFRELRLTASTFELLRSSSEMDTTDAKCIQSTTAGEASVAKAPASNNRDKRMNASKSKQPPSSLPRKGW